MFSEPQTPGTVFEDGFSETRRPIFDRGSSGASEASIIQTKLKERLGPEYVSQRPAPGGGPKLTYVEGWKIIGLANGGLWLQRVVLDRDENRDGLYRHGPRIKEVQRRNYCPCENHA